ncbi:MAG TPA: ABC transporter permease subunit, partial [Actinomycetota bacterium]|nr:ABC transporter permease subunit [Actinomycetota bacterium]
MTALVLSELRQRIRGKRWWILLALWTLALTGLLWLVKRGTEAANSFDPEPIRVQAGTVMFGSLALFVLGLACLVIPALTSTSINGERDRGTLAVLQSTLLKPRDIVMAKFVAAMLIALAFLGATFPLALWCTTEGDVDLGRMVAVYLILVLMCALMCLIGLTASTLIRKPSLSAVAAYGAVFVLTAGSPIIFALSLASAPQVGFEREVGWRWVILAPDPFVILADAAPRTTEDTFTFSDPLEGIRDAVRGARRPPRPVDPATGLPLDQDGVVVFENVFQEPEREPPALWPTGVLIDLAIAGLCAWACLHRLRIPARRLAVGERVA